MSEFRTGWFEAWRERAGDRWWWPLAGVGVLVAGLIVWGVTRSSSNEEQAVAPPAATGQSPAAPEGNAAEGRAAPDGRAAPEGRPAPPSSGVAVPPPARAAATVDAGAQPSPTVKLTFRTFPAKPAVVMWGSKRLGIIDRNKPLVVERPRDSGTVDVIIRSTGYVPVHTRAYTFTDSNIDVKITPLDKKDTLYGYKEPILDAGVPFPVEATDMP